MTRTMGDTIGANADRLPETIQLVAGYDTGTTDVIWTTADWALFPGKVHVHIDQAFGDTRAIEAHVMVFDVEQGAFSPDQAEALINANTSPRPTIYVNRDNMYATIASAQNSPKWKGDIWLAFPGWNGDTRNLPPIPPNTRYVAIQDTFLGDFDLSRVLDDSWPGINWTEEMMQLLPTVHKGMTGLFVRRVQGLCNADGHTIAIDGAFGPATEAAVKNLQTAAAITADGIVGPQTWPVLLGV